MATDGSDADVLRLVNTLARYVVSPPKQAVDVSERVQIIVGGGRMGFEMISEVEVEKEPRGCGTSWDTPKKERLSSGC